MSGNDPHSSSNDPPDWSQADEHLWSLVEKRLENSLHPLLSPSEETTRFLDVGAAAVWDRSDGGEDENLFEEFQRAARDLDFERELMERRQGFSLGTYLTFLMRVSGTTAVDLAKDADFEFQTLKDLQADRVSIRDIAPSDLARLLSSLRASWSFTEKSLLSLVRAPRYEYVGTRNSLFRRAPGSGARSAVEDSLAAGGEEGQRVPNPAHREEVNAVRSLLREVKSQWRAGS